MESAPPVNISKTIVSETRATHPVFEYREKGTYRNDYLWHNPQNFVFMPFQNNLDTNIENNLFNKRVDQLNIDELVSIYDFF